MTSTGQSRKPIFRSYVPKDDSLKQASLPKIEPQKIDGEDESVSTEIPEIAPPVENVDLVSLAPRKIDWDLKRDVAKKLEKLERRTQRAVAELIRERLAAGKEELLAAVNSSADAAARCHGSDDEND